MANRKRNIQVKFYVTAEEKELMEQKMTQLQTNRIGAYLRKMAIDGYIIQVDTKDITSAAAPKQITCRLVSPNRTLLCIRLRSFGIVT